MANSSVRRLGPEPWGAQLARARETAGLTMREAVELLYPHVARTALYELERLEHPPEGRRDRARAALLIMLYDFALDDFGLSEADLPPAIDLAGIRRLALTSTGGIRNKCFGAAA